MLPDTHLRITFRHVAKNESRDKADKTFAFTFLKIMNDDGSIIKDGLHELYVYKVGGACCHGITRSHDSSDRRRPTRDGTTRGSTCLSSPVKRTLLVEAPRRQGASSP